MTPADPSAMRSGIERHESDRHFDVANTALQLEEARITGWRQSATAGI